MISTPEYRATPSSSGPAPVRVTQEVPRISQYFPCEAEVVAAFQAFATDIAQGKKANGMGQLIALYTSIHPQVAIYPLPQECRLGLEGSPLKCQKFIEGLHSSGLLEALDELSLPQKASAEARLSSYWLPLFTRLANRK